MAEIRATPQQRAAAEDRGGALLVAAAAGSGKTKVLVDRLMGYLTDPTDPADLDEFLIITYTRAAASELRGKIAARIAEALAGTPNDRHLQRQLTRVYLAQISTVHSSVRPSCGSMRQRRICLPISAWRTSSRRRLCVRRRFGTCSPSCMRSLTTSRISPP